MAGVRTTIPVWAGTNSGASGETAACVWTRFCFTGCWKQPMSKWVCFSFGSSFVKSGCLSLTMNDFPNCQRSLACGAQCGHDNRKAILKLCGFSTLSHYFLFSRNLARKVFQTGFGHTEFNRGWIPSNLGFDNAIAKLLEGDCTAPGPETRKCEGRSYAVFPVLLWIIFWR